MKTRIVVLIAVFLITQAVTHGQKTKVSVHKGKVIAQTAQGSVTVDAGRKAVLMLGKEPVVTVDDPLVDDIMNIYKWVEAEKQAQRVEIDTSFIIVNKIDDEHMHTVAYLAEMQNTESEPSNTFRMEGSILEAPKYYDLQGNLLKFDLEKKNDKRGQYTLYFSEPVAPGNNFRYICVSKAKPLQGFIKEGPLRLCWEGWNFPNQLNYFRFILPESAVFVDSSRPATIMDSHDGRTSVTVRNYTGPLGDGMVKIAFLWPDVDGTTLMDLPPQYRGLPDQYQEEITKRGGIAIEKILAGDIYNDQITPLEAVKSTCSAIIHKNKELLLSLMDESIREDVRRQYDQIVDESGKKLVEFEFLDTPQWPDKPENGFTHPVYLCRKGSLLRALILTMVYRDGKWYLHSTELKG